VRSGAHVDPLTRHSPALRSTGRIINNAILEMTSIKLVFYVSRTCSSSSLLCQNRNKSLTDSYVITDTKLRMLVDCYGLVPHPVNNYLCYPAS